MASEPTVLRFNFLVALFVLSINILIYFPRLITLLLGWDGLGLTRFLLIIYYQNPKSLGAGIITAVTNRLGDAFILNRNRSHSLQQKLDFRPLYYYWKGNRGLKELGDLFHSLILIPFPSGKVINPKRKAQKTNFFLKELNFPQGKANWVWPPKTPWFLPRPL